MTVRRRPAVSSCAILMLALCAGCPADEETDEVCAIHPERGFCVYRDSYDPAAFDDGWETLTVFSGGIDSCIEACDALGVVRTVKMALIVDDASYTISDAEAQQRVDVASDLLFGLTGTTLELHGIQHIASPSVSVVDDMEAYFADHVDDPPHFIVVASAAGGAANNGGYAISTSLLDGFCNNFASPETDKKIYGAVVDWTHRFSACGYDVEHYRQTLEWVEVSDVSLDDGSCTATAGVACAFNETVGYNVCSNTDADNPYLATAETFVSTVFIHEIMHSFGPNGNLDHFGTTTCDEIMGGTAYKDGAFAFQQHFGMCPYVYDHFVDGYAETCAPSSEDCAPAPSFLPTLPAPEPNGAEVKIGGLDSVDWVLVETVLGGASDPWVLRLRYEDPNDLTRAIHIDLPELAEETCVWSVDDGAPESASPHVHLFMNGEERVTTSTGCALTISDAWNFADGDVLEGHTSACQLSAPGSQAYALLEMRFAAEVASGAP